MGCFPFHTQIERAMLNTEVFATRVSNVPAKRTGSGKFGEKSIKQSDAV